MKACRDCIHIGPVDEFGIREPRCQHAKSYVEMADYLNGIKRTVLHGINSMRAIGPCGPEGTLFAAKED